MIAGDHGNAVGWTEASEKFPAGLKLRSEREIDEVARDGNVVRLYRREIGDERVDHGRTVMRAAPQPPVEPAGDALAEEIGEADVRHGRQVRIGKVGEREHECHSGGCATSPT